MEDFLKSSHLRSLIVPHFFTEGPDLPQNFIDNVLVFRTLFAASEKFLRIRTARPSPATASVVRLLLAILKSRSGLTLTISCLTEDASNSDNFLG